MKYMLSRKSSYPSVSALRAYLRYMFPWLHSLSCSSEMALRHLNWWWEQCLSTRQSPVCSVNWLDRSQWCQQWCPCQEERLKNAFITEFMCWLSAKRQKLSLVPSKYSTVSSRQQSTFNNSDVLDTHGRVCAHKSDIRFGTVALEN